MDRKKIEELLDLIVEVTAEGEPWKKKKQQVLDLASEEQRTALLEFISWFEGD